jgi:hypothetical protein
MIDAKSRYYRGERATYTPDDDGLSASYEAPDGSTLAIHVASDGNTVPYLKRRLLPQPDAIGIMSVATVRAGQRLDVIAARLVGDPLEFWRLADANNAMNPFDLAAVPGRLLRIPKPGQ